MADGDDDDAEKAQDLLSGSKNQTRHGAEAPDEDNESSLTVYDLVQEYHARMEADEVSENLTFRDSNFAALLRSLEDAGKLDEVIRRAESALDIDESDRGGKGVALRLLVRVGLQNVAPDAIETANEARREYRFEQVEQDEF